MKNLERRSFVGLAGSAVAFLVGAPYAEAKSLFGESLPQYACVACGGDLLSFRIDSGNVLSLGEHGGECVVDGETKANLRCVNGCVVWSRGQDTVWLLLARSRLMAASKQALPNDHLRILDDRHFGGGRDCSLAVRVRRGWHNSTFVIVVGTADEVLAMGHTLSGHVRAAAERAGLI